jgi:hypothetical protein
LPVNVHIALAAEFVLAGLVVEVEVQLPPAQAKLSMQLRSAISP